MPVLVADSAEEIADRLIAASIAVSRMSEIGVDRDAIARQVLTGGGIGSTVTDEDTIV